jgi:hypothetical protein
MKIGLFKDFRRLSPNHHRVVVQIGRQNIRRDTFILAKAVIFPTVAIYWKGYYFSLIIRPATYH